MKKSLFFVLSASLISNFNLHADEGMWLLTDVQNCYTQMSNLGLEMKPEDIYSEQNPSLKDAVIIFGNGCTGEIVSSQGLIFTNHHCGYGAIQALSTVENDILQQGFWAKSQNQELYCKDLSIKFLRKNIDVTDSIIPFIDTLQNEARDKKLDEITERLVKNEKANGRYDVSVKPFFNGNKYFLIVYEVFKDVRLVGAPPSSIGKFGADTDNWMWPRHNGDFSVFRVYADSAGNPTPYDSTNVPLKTRNYFNISLKGFHENDFTLILGFPGHIDRYFTSSQINEEYETINPLRIQIRTIKQEIWANDMKNNKKINIQYASKYARSSNYWKYFIGQNEGIKKENLILKIQKRDHEFINWSEQNEERKKMYANCISDIDSLINSRKELSKSLTIFQEALWSSVELCNYSRNYFSIYQNQYINDSKISLLKNDLSKFYKDYSIETDIKVASAMFQLMGNILDEKNSFPELKHYQDIPNKKSLRRTRSLFLKSIFRDSMKMKNLLQEKDVHSLDNDKLFKISINAYKRYYELYSKQNELKQKLEEKERLFTKGIMQMYDGKKNLYPNANSTMRFSYGTIKSLQPRDAVSYYYLTNLEGVFEKENPNSIEFQIPEKLKSIYKAKDFGNYAVNGKVPVAFLTNNDITGGNSGSPILNSKGQLIGIAFDGNWEGLTGEFQYNPEMQRTIGVDIRYVLFIIDKFGEANYLFNELNIIK